MARFGSERSRAQSSSFRVEKALVLLSDFPSGERGQAYTELIAHQVALLQQSVGFDEVALRPHPRLPAGALGLRDRISERAPGLRIASLEEQSLPLHQQLESYDIIIGVWSSSLVSAANHSGSKVVFGLEDPSILAGERPEQIEGVHWLSATREFPGLVSPGIDALVEDRRVRTEANRTLADFLCDEFKQHENL